MKTFSEYDGVEDETLNEDFLRNASALVLFNRILGNSKKVHRSKNVNEKLNLIASQNTTLSAMIFTMTTLVKKSD
jgi:hypothetical protein